MHHCRYDGAQRAGEEQSPNHRHRNVKAFEEPIQKHVYYLFGTE